MQFIIITIPNLGSRVIACITVIAAAASHGLAAGSLLVDRAEASPAHRSADPEVEGAGIASSAVNTLASVRPGVASCRHRNARCPQLEVATPIAPPPFRPRLPCSYLAKSRPQRGYWLPIL